MAKKQTRKSVSVSRATYDKLKAFCEDNNTNMSQFVEARIAEHLSMQPPPEPRAPRFVRKVEPSQPVIARKEEKKAPAAPPAPTPDRIFTF